MTTFKNFILFVFIFIISNFLNSIPANAQDYSQIMYDLYAESVLYPENFDSVIANNRRLFDNYFDSCLHNLTMAYMEAGRREMQICNGHTNPRWRSQCLQESTSASMWMWCLSLRAALDGTPWQRTTTGSNTLFAKQMLEQLMGAGSYASSMRQFIPMMRPYFRCQ
jgi:hypothetical protein